MSTERRIRVLITAFAPVPGANPHAAALAGMASAIRADLDMVTLKTDSLSHVEHFGSGRMFRVPVAGAPKEQRAGFSRAIARQMEAQEYDVVHVRGPLEGLGVAERKAESDFRFVYEMATFPDEAEGSDIEAAWGEAHAKCLEAADLILVPTEAATRLLAEKGHAGKVAVVHPGVDVEVFDWWPAAGDEVLRLLYLGSFSADRDMATFLTAIRTVSRARPVRTLMAGEPDPSRRERLRRMVAAFNLGRIVDVRGEPRSATLPFVIAAADLGVVPAAATPRFQEMGDLPQPLLEYMACRRPVIAAGVPGVSEVIRDEREGLLYLPGDDASLAEAVMTLIEDGQLWEKAVSQAYERVRRAFSGSARRRRIAEVYEMLIPGSQGYDAWLEGFDQPATGQLEAPDSSVPSPPSSGQVPSDYPSEDTRPHHAPDAEDGRPITHVDSAPPEPTRIDPIPVAPGEDTDEHAPDDPTSELDSPTERP